MIRREKDGVAWLEFEQLAKVSGLKHGVFLRHGGQSSGDRATLNVSYDTGDDKANVRANLAKIEGCLELPSESLVWGVQCHGVDIYDVTQKAAQNVSCDALATSERNTPLMIKHADCQAAIFYDSEKDVIANVHSGWRGSVQNIYAKTIEFMKKKYGSNLEDLLVCISPSLGPNEAEFLNYQDELPKNFWQFQVKPNYFDFWAISRMQLEECGILPGHIEIAEISTHAHPEDYFSHRRGKDRGRHGTVVALL